MNEQKHILQSPTIIVTAVLIAVLLFWLLGFFNGNDSTAKTTALPASIETQNRLHQFNSNSLVTLMSRYYELMVDNKTRRNLNIIELQNLLFLFGKEHSLLARHQELIGKSTNKPSIRRKQTFQHYKNSIETIMADLKKQIKRIQNINKRSLKRASIA
jgi:hypothetical protein